MIGTGLVERVFTKDVPRSRVVKVNLSDGSSIFTTKEHRFFTGEGWIDAELLQKNDCLFSSPCYGDSHKESKGLGVSDVLQGGCGKQGPEDGCRGRWEKPSLEREFIARREEGCSAGVVRVESVEIYERGNNDRSFEGCFDGPEGDTVTFYDLQVSNHPSYYAGNVLVHNCHALTKAAQEAFLKLLEDPPAYVYFMLATTDPGKLLPTVKTRCSAVPLTALTAATMTKFLTKFTADHLPDFELSEDAVALLTAKALGSPRRALVLLEGLATQDIGEQKKYLESIQEEETQSIELCRALIRGAKWKEVAEILKGLKEEDPEGIRHHVLGYARAILLGSGPDACKAFCVIDSFRDNFYDSKHAGLAASCWEVINGGEK